MTDPAISPSDTDNSAATAAEANDDTSNASGGAAAEATEVDHKAEAEKWKALARKHEGQAKSNADAAKELAEIKDKDKSEAQRQADALTASQAEAEKLKRDHLRLNVAIDKAPEGMPLSKVKKLAQRLTGDTQEELEADAEELFADFTPTDTDGDKGGGDKNTGKRLPTERLKQGTVPGAEPDETDPNKLAAQVPRRY